MRKMLLAQVALASALLAGMALEPSISAFASSAIRLFTEGNTYGKHFVFLSFFIFVGGLKLLAGAREPSFLKRFSKDRLKMALATAIVAGYLFNVSASLMLLDAYSAPINGYIAHVTDCGNANCWEASYLQHSHALKPMVHLLDKTLGLNLGSNADTGKPMYETVPNADVIAIATLLILLAIAALSALLAFKEKKFAGLFLLQFSAIVCLVTVLDGGPFTVAGINAIVLLALYSSHEKRISWDWKFFSAIFCYVYFVGQILPVLVGTNLVFLGYFAPSLFLVSLFMLGRARHVRLPKLAFLAAILLLAFSSYYLLDLFKFVYYGEQASPGGKIIVYGFPDSPQSDAAINSLSPHISSYYRYGWYAAIVPGRAEYVNEFVARLRPKVKPPGYFLGEVDYQQPRIGAVRVILRSGPIPISISTRGFNATGRGFCSGDCTLTGSTNLYATHLALEVGSYLHSEGYDALVITPVMWDYG